MNSRSETISKPLSELSDAELIAERLRLWAEMAQAEYDRDLTRGARLCLERVWVGREMARRASERQTTKKEDRPMPDLPPTNNNGFGSLTQGQREAARAQSKASRDAHQAWRADRTLALPDGSAIRPDSLGTSTGQGAGWLLEGATGRSRYYRDPRTAFAIWAHETGSRQPRPECLDLWALEWPAKRSPAGKCGSLEIEQITTMRAAGLSLLEIALIAGSTEHAISNFCHRRGVVGPHGGARYAGITDAE